MAEKLLAEWFWTDRWMGSSGFLLPMEARGVYREMLTQAWRRGARLPNDHEAIRRATSATAEEWARAWPLIAKFWIVDGDSLVNETQLEVYADAKSRSDRASHRGRLAAQAMHKQSTSRAQAVLKHQPPSPSPSPVIKKEERTYAKRRADGVTNGAVCSHLPRCQRTDECIRKSLERAS